MGRYLKSLSLKLLTFFFTFFFTVNSSWAMPDDFSQSGKDQPIVNDTQITAKKDGSFKTEQKNSSEKKESLTRGQKTLLLNAGAWAAIMGYGLAEWDYNKSSFHFKKEGWFGRDTPYGGADKLGHAWSCYVMSHLFAYLYRKWEYADREANLYGALSSFGVNAVMEIFDGFSPSEGFSYEDMTMNILGCGLGYILGEYPSLARKFDFRWEDTPKFDYKDLKIGTTYERHMYLLVAKADGFDFIENPYLKYLEFHLGYSARGYDDYEKGGPDDRHRRIYAGLGFNVSKLLQKYVKTTVFDYVQVPYTSIRQGFPLD